MQLVRRRWGRGIQLGILVLLVLNLSGPDLSSAAQEHGAVSVHDAAERLLAATPGAVGGRMDREVSASLWIGGWPPDLPLKVPLPPGGRLVGSVRYETDEEFFGPSSWTFAVVDVPLPERSAYAYYSEALNSMGWELPPPDPLFDSVQGGFSDPGPLGRRPVDPVLRSRSFGWLEFCEPGGHGVMQVSIVGRGTESEARLTISSGDGRSGRSIECYAARAQSRTDVPPGLATRSLPDLRLPVGVEGEVVPGNTSLGMGSAATTAHAVTDRSLAELAGSLADQLNEAGWRRTNGGEETHLVWSTWDVPFGDGFDRGWLLVNRVPGTQRVSMEVRVESLEMGDMLWLPRASMTSVMGPAPAR